MKAALPLALLLPLQASGQCTMTADAWTQGGCWGPNTVVMSFSVIITGGTPPYTIHYGPPFQQQTGTATSWSFGALISPQQQCGVMWPYGSLYTCQVVDAVGCVWNGSASMGVPAAVFELAGLTRETVVETDNTVTVRFGNPPQGGCQTYMPPTGSPWFNYLNYSLSRNGAPYQSGAMASVFSAQKLVFGHLPPGTYLWQFSASQSSSNSPWWCFPDQHAYTMQVPNAADVGVNVRIAAALGGSLVGGGLMHDSLRADGLVPLVEPYSAAGYVYVGTVPGASIAPALLATTGSTAVVDWVVAELRSSVAPYAVIASRPALIRRDGEVIDLDGDAYVNFPGLAAGSYRIALRHRNHLGVMTSSAHSLGFVPERANFRTGGAYGTTPQTSVGGVQCLWPGDCAADGTVRYVGSNNDRDPILTGIGGSVPTNVVSNVYSPTDVNMDGNIRYVGTNNDRDAILTTVGGTVPTATRTQQLP